MYPAAVHERGLFFVSLETLDWLPNSYKSVIASGSWLSLSLSSSVQHLQFLQSVSGELSPQHHPVTSVTS